MRTDDLIRALAEDRATPVVGPQRRVVLALAGGGAVTAALFFWLFGMRGDIASALSTWRFDFKLVTMAALFAAAMIATLRLGRPTANTANAVRPILLVVLLLLAGLAAELVLVPSGDWSARLFGKNRFICLAVIPLLSVAPLAAILTAMRESAPASPSLAGAFSGLLAGALAAILYASHCTDDSPLFVLAWYTIAIALVMAVGALAGRTMLRW